VQNFGETALRPLEVAPRHQELPDIAAAGDVKLAVWLETMTSERTRTVVARRFDAAGNPLDPQPIELGSVFNPYQLHVASNGTGWLVVWRNDDRCGVWFDENLPDYMISAMKNEAKWMEVAGWYR